MRLSLITINFNNRDGLRKTIDSVVAQTFKDFEWIVIDGGSTDGGRELLEQHASHFAYWVSEPDKGIYNAMNKGVDQAKGDYLLFLNSGDWLYNETSLERCMTHDFNAEVVYGNCVFHYVDHDVKRHYPSNLTFEFLYRSSLAHCCSFIKREVLVKEHYNEDYKIVSDLEFWVKLVFLGGSFCHIDEFVSVFDTTGISSTNHDLDVSERKQMMSRYVPEMVVADYLRLETMQEKLSDEQVKGVLQYGHKKKLYHKLITSALVKIRVIEKIFG
jgi:glycosyltransferase involved in cell wall biosynthesis